MVQVQVKTLDRLDKLFMRQDVLQRRLGNFPLEPHATQQFITTQSIALIDEVMEALRETPWKPWKKQQPYEQENFKEELVDAWHFLINLSLASGMNSNELFKRFIKKNKANHKRQDNDY